MPRDCGAGDWACTPHPHPRWEGCIASILCVSSGAPTPSCDLYLQLCKLTAWYLGHLRSLYFWELNLSLSLPCSYKFNFEKAGEKKISSRLGHPCGWLSCEGSFQAGGRPKKLPQAASGPATPVPPGHFQGSLGRGPHFPLCDC